MIQIRFRLQNYEKLSAEQKKRVSFLCRNGVSSRLLSQNLRISERNAKQKRKIFERKDSKLVSLALSKKFQDN